MDIVRYINTPKNTTESNPVLTPIKLTKGRLTGASLYFPSGPAGTLHFIARIGIHQIVPFNTGQNLRLDDCVLPLSLGFELVEPPYELVCQTWNDSTLYDHALTLVLYLNPKIEDRLDVRSLIDKFWEMRSY